MTDYTRGRSPSAGNRNQAISRSPSSHNQAFNPQANALGLDPSLSAPQASFDPSLYPPPQHPQQQPQQQQQQFTDPSHFFPVQNDFSRGNLQDQNSQFQASLNTTPLDFIPNQQDFDLGASLDLGQDPTQLQNMLAFQQQQQQQQHLFPTNNFAHPENVSPSSMQNGNGRHSRNQSLDPSAAYLVPQNGDWSGMQFMGHRHQPSDGAFSDVSSQHSPYMNNDNSFEGLGSNSPLLSDQDPTTMNNALGIEQFPLNLSDHYPSPNHSAQPSPLISPHQNVPPFLSTENLVLSDFPGHQGPDIDLSPSTFPPMMQHSVSRDSNGLDSTMSPPQINIVTAPPETSKMGSEMEQSMLSGDALSPPGRSGRARQRAISESGVVPGSPRAASPAHQRSGSVGLRPPQGASRSTSPNGGIHKMRRYSTPERHWALDLAERQAQQQSGANGTEAVSPYQANPTAATASTGSDSNRRVQKHPATFQCHLCPKRFTRAYNLRSHLRTHTDERPFVCTVCGKAFARQHDRKRHEGLHSGEKKFVCKGLLQSAGGQGQQTWGCGRRFARADALGRHFRSEAGRACIKPLLDEEARERRAAAMEQANQDMMNGVNGGLMPHAQFNQPDYSLDSSTFAGMALPAALLQQYPALADIQWNAIPGPGQDDGDMGGSNYDVSSGGELDEEDDTGYVSGPGAVSGGDRNRLSASFNSQGGWVSDGGF